MLSLLFALTLLTPGAERPVTLPAAARPIGAFIQFGRSVGLVVWSEYDETTRIGRIRAVRITREGVPLDRQPIEIAHSSIETAAALAFDGARFLVVWAREQDGTIIGQRIGEDGMFVDLLPFVLGTSIYANPPMPTGCGDQECLVAWPAGSKIMGAIVPANGSAGRPFTIAADTNPFAVMQTSRPAFGSGGFAVAWSTFVNSGGPFPKPSGTGLTFVSKNGIVSKQVWLREEKTGSLARWATVAWNGTEFAAFWEIDQALYGARFSANGDTLQPPTPVGFTGDKTFLGGVASVRGDWLLLLYRPDLHDLYGLYLSPTLRRELLFDVGADAGFSSDETPLLVYTRDGRAYMRALDVPASAEPPRRRVVHQ